jgi:hypothetical protein
MIINISKFDNESYMFASKYLETHGKQHRWDPQYAMFDFELSQKRHDNEDFNIDPNVFNWEHLMVAERYIDKHERNFDRDTNQRRIYSELGLDKRRKISNGGSKTKRRGRRRVRTHRRRA